MQIFVNDSPTECQEGCTVSSLLSQQGIAPVNIAVAINNVVIPKARWDTTILSENSDILIIKAVQGG